jgi:hypothetical protein
MIEPGRFLVSDQRGERDMRFMMLVKSAENALGPPPPALMEAMGKLGEQSFKSGIMVEMGGLCATAMGARVRLANGALNVIDGPFTEAKEVIGGYAVFELDSREAAIEQAIIFMDIHKEHWPEWSGETEVRQIVSQPG